MRNNILLAGLLCIFLSCNRTPNSNKEMLQIADTTSNAFGASSAAVQKNTDSTRKFIRTADVKFKVKSVMNTTNNIEAICTGQGGFVTYTNLASNIDNKTEIPISADSTLESINFTVTNSIILRVPNAALDSTLKEIAKNIDYLDYRIIKADDVGLQMFANSLLQNRAIKHEARLTNDIDNNNKKLKETTTAEELLLSKQTQADDAKISNLSLRDKINFSTVNILIYQRQTVKQTVVANNKNTTAYEPGLGSKIWDALLFGWNMIVELLLFVLKLWALFLFVFLFYWLYKWYNRKVNFGS